MVSTDRTLRKYYWVPRSDLAFLQAVLDGHEGLGRMRTEKHDGEKSLILVMVSEKQLPELERMFSDLLRHDTIEIQEAISSI